MTMFVCWVYIVLCSVGLWKSIVGPNTPQQTLTHTAHNARTMHISRHEWYFFFFDFRFGLIDLFIRFFPLSFILFLFIRFLCFVSLIHRLFCCHFVPFFACTGNNVASLLSYFFRRFFFFRTLLERGKTFGSWTGEPNEWMCRILFMSQLSIRWFFSPLTVCVRVLVSRTANGFACGDAFESNSFALLHDVNQNKFI